MPFGAVSMEATCQDEEIVSLPFSVDETLPGVLFSALGSCLQRNMTNHR